ncbi:MAG: DUF721 domain-containing protein [Planctomycetaceae bacterium]
MSEREGPQPLAAALSELFAVRGFARVQGQARLADAWAEVAGQWAGQTRATGVQRGVLQVAVNNAPLRSELEGFHKAELLAAVQHADPGLSICDIRFRLQGRMEP